jgi:hypothetical protein
MTGRLRSRSSFREPAGAKVRRSRPSRRNAGRPPGATGHVSGARTGRGSVPGSRHVVRAEQDALVYDAEGLHGNPSRARVAGGTIGPGVRALYQPTEKAWPAPLSRALRAAPPAARTDNVRFRRPRPCPRPASSSVNGVANGCGGRLCPSASPPYKPHSHQPNRVEPALTYAQIVRTNGPTACRVCAPNGASAPARLQAVRDVQIDRSGSS